MNCNIGDIVRIITKEKLLKIANFNIISNTYFPKRAATDDLNTVHFNKQMECFCGHVVEISDINTNNGLEIYKVNDLSTFKNDENNFDFHWQDWMFMPGKINLSECIDNYCKSCPLKLNSLVGCDENECRLYKLKHNDLLSYLDLVQIYDFCEDSCVKTCNKNNCSILKIKKFIKNCSED